MRNHGIRVMILGVTGIFVMAGAMGTSCTGGGVLGVNAGGKVTGVQLFDEPNFTMALSVADAVNNPAGITKINWVFGDGGGFVEGPANQNSITHQYALAGTYLVTAYIFGPQGFVDQVDGSINIIDNGGGSGSGGGGSGSVTEPPGAATGLVPVDLATDVAVTVKLKWTAGKNATSHDVYFGTDKTAVAAATHSDATNFKGNVLTTTYDPADADVSGDTNYYWRIDEVNAIGTTPGTVVTFKTAKPPLKAKDPVPANTSMSARLDQVLSWTAGTRANSHDVYFGKTFAGVDGATKDTADIFIGNQTALTYDPSDEDADVTGDLVASTSYYWRIDEVGTGGTTKGDVWQFTTKPPPPPITNPDPSDMSTGVSVTKNLAWDAPGSVESFDVYFGTSELDVMLASHASPEFKVNQTGKTFNPGTLLADLDYFWRIDTINGGGTSAGTTLKFTTAALPASVMGPFTPADLSTNIQVDTILKWFEGVGGPVTSYDLYLSTDQSAINNPAQSALQGNVPVGTTSFNLANDLAANTDYYWRLVSKGPGGKQNGPIATFRTGVLPEVAKNPNPLNNAVGVSLNVTLSWTAGANPPALSHDVYFGTNQSSVNTATLMDAEFKGNQLLPIYAPAALEANKDYFWRIDEVASGGRTKGPVWKFTTGPGKAVAPSPPDGSSGAALDIILSWTSGSGATNQDVYFGTDQTAVTNANIQTAGVYRGRQTATTYDPPEVLTGNTFYYWRIDSVSSTGVITKGDVWSTKTAVGKPTSPIPPDKSTGQDLNVDIQWTAGAANVSFDVYFGTSLAAVTNATHASPEFKGNQVGTSYDPGALAVNTDYYWRIDGVAADASVATGDVWHFKTLDVPGQAGNPSPGNGATGVSNTAPTLSWGLVPTATGYDVYFNGVLVSPNQPGNTYLPGALAPSTMYTWRIDPKNAAGTTTGVTWSFTTGP